MQAAAPNPRIVAETAEPPPSDMPSLIRQALMLAAALGQALPQTKAAHALRMWPHAALGHRGMDEGHKAAQERERLSRAADGSDQAFWMRLQQAKSAGNGAALDAFAAGALDLWRQASEPESAKLLIEICADAAWRSVARAKLGGAWAPEEASLDRKAGLELEAACSSLFARDESMLGIKMTLVGAMCAPWLADAASLGLSAKEAGEQARAFRAAASDGASMAYRSKSGVGVAREDGDNPIEHWRAAGFDARALRVKLNAWRQADPFAASPSARPR